jgi:hypothetical protein
MGVSADMRYVQWGSVTLVIIVPFGLLTLFFWSFSSLAFTLITKYPGPWPTVGYEVAAAMLLLVVAVACGSVCILRVVGRPVGRWACFSLGMAFLVYVGITAWRPTYFMIY